MTYWTSQVDSGGEWRDCRSFSSRSEALGWTKVVAKLTRGARYRVIEVEEKVIWETDEEEVRRGA